MPQKVLLEDRGVAVEFPDTWTPDQIEDSIGEKVNPFQLQNRRESETKFKDTVDAVVLDASRLWQTSKEALLDYFPKAVLTPPDVEPHPIFKGMFIKKGRPGISLKEAREAGALEQLRGKPAAGLALRAASYLDLHSWRPISPSEVAQQQQRADFFLGWFQKKLEKSKENYNRWLQDHPELAPRKEYAGNVRDRLAENPSLVYDPAFWVYKTAENFTFTAAIMGTMAVTTAATRSLGLGVKAATAVGLTAGAAVSLPVISEDLLNEVRLQAGGKFTEREMLDLTTQYAPFIASIEVLGDFAALTNVAGTAFQQTFRNRLIKNVVKRSLAQRIAATTGQFAKGYAITTVGETAEEVAQGAAEDAALQTVNEHHKMLEDYKDIIANTMGSMWMWGAGGGSFRAADAWGQYYEHNQRRPMSEAAFTTQMRLRHAELIGKEAEMVLTPQESAELNNFRAMQVRPDSTEIDMGMAAAVYGVRFTEAPTIAPVVKEVPATPFGFRSKLEEVVDAIDQPRFTGEQVIPMLKKAGVSNVELDWILGEMLWDEEKNDFVKSVTKEQLLDAIRTKQFLVEDYQWGDSGEGGYDSEERDELYSEHQGWAERVVEHESEMEEADERIREVEDEVEVAKDEKRSVEEDINDKLNNEEITQQEAADALEELDDKIATLESQLETYNERRSQAENDRDSAQNEADEYLSRYENWEPDETEEEGEFWDKTVKQGWHYREVLLKLPSIYGSFYPDHWSGRNAENTFVHLRFATSTDAKDRLLTLVSEIQSDWNISLGREGGAGIFYDVVYKQEDKKTKKLEENKRRFKSKALATTFQKELVERNIESERIEVEGRGERDFPLKGIFSDVALKWLVMDAVRNGHEAVTWISGHDTRGIYHDAIRHKVDYISYAQNPDGTYQAIPYTQGGSQVEVGKGTLEATKYKSLKKLTEIDLRRIYGIFFTNIITGPQPVGGTSRRKQEYEDSPSNFTDPKIEPLTKPTVSLEVWQNDFDELSSREYRDKYPAPAGNDLTHYYRDDDRFKLTGTTTDVDAGETIVVGYGKTEAELNEFLENKKLPRYRIEKTLLYVGGEWSTRTYGDFKADIERDYPNRPEMLDFAYEGKDASRFSLFAKRYLKKLDGEVETINVASGNRRRETGTSSLFFAPNIGEHTNSYERVGGKRDEWSVVEEPYVHMGAARMALEVQHKERTIATFSDEEVDNQKVAAQRFIDMQVRVGAIDRDKEMGGYHIKEQKTIGGKELNVVMLNEETIDAFADLDEAKTFIQNELAPFKTLPTRPRRGFYIPDALKRKVKEIGLHVAEKRKVLELSRQYSTEDSVAYGSTEEKNRRFKEFLKTHGGQGKILMEASKQLREQGNIDMRGTTLNNQYDTAEVGSLYRDPTIEQSQVIYRDRATNKVLSHSIETIGNPGTFPLGKTVKQIIKTLVSYRERGIDADFYILHNHPTGDIQPSSNDIQATAVFKETFGTIFRGHIILDSERFTFIDVTPEKGVSVQALSYLKGAKTNWTGDLVDVRALVRQGKVPTDRNHWTVLFINNDNKLLGVGRVGDKDTNRWQYIKHHQRAHMASRYVIVTEGEVLSEQKVLDWRVAGFGDMIRLVDGRYDNGWLEQHGYSVEDQKRMQEEEFDFPLERQAFPTTTDEIVRVAEPSAALNFTKVVDDQGKPKVLYSGHMNVSLYGQFDPKKATAGAFFATEDAQIASSYAMGKMGQFEYYEGGAQYVLKDGRRTKKLWNYALTREQKDTLIKLENLPEADEMPDGYEMGEYKNWRHNHKDFERDARVAFYNPYDLVNIWKFYEYAGYNIAYDADETFKTAEGEELGDGSFMDYVRKNIKDFDIKQFQAGDYDWMRKAHAKKMSVAKPSTRIERQRKNRFEELLDVLGIRWESYERHQPGVMAVYLDIRNPVIIEYIDAAANVTERKVKHNLPEGVMEELERVGATEDRLREARGETYEGEHWTRDYPLSKWVQDIKDGNEFWATQIPTSARRIFKKHGFDGIKDKGGKTGGQEHAVWIAFDTDQIHSAWSKENLRQDAAWQPLVPWGDDPGVDPDHIINEADKTEGSEAEVKTSKLVRMRDTTLAKIKAKKLQEGIRKGGVISRDEVKRVQGEVKKMLQGLDFEGKGRLMGLVTGQLTQAQLERHMDEIRERLAVVVDKTKVDAYVKAIRRLGQVQNVAPDYKEQIDALLEDYDLKRRTAKTHAKRAKRSEFLEKLRASGDMQGIPDALFVDLGKKTLDQMEAAEVRELHDVLKMLVHLGQLKETLLSRNDARLLEAEVDQLVTSLYRKTNRTEDAREQDILNTLEELRKEREKSKSKKTWDLLRGVWFQHIKIEHHSISHGIHDLFIRVHEGIDRRKVLAEKYYDRLETAFKQLGDYTKKFTETVEFQFEAHTESEFAALGTQPQEVKGPRTFTLTRQQIIGVALNSGNEGNLQRLQRGYGLSEANIAEIKSHLSDSEKQFVEDIHNLFDEMFPAMNETLFKMLGIKAKKVSGKYFPIVVNRDLSKLQQLRDASIDLFTDTFMQAYIERGMTKTRKGGSEPVDLDILGVITQHVDNVLTFTTMAIPIRDAQKIITHPRFRKAITNTAGKEMYGEYRRWLVDTANPRENRAKDAAGRLVQLMRHNATGAILGYKVTVSLVQGGSIFQAIHIINRHNNNREAVGHTSRAAIDYLRHRGELKAFVYDLSVGMRNRRNTMDREIKDFIESKMQKKLAKGVDLSSKDWEESMFDWIVAIDEQTTMTTWLAAYNSLFDIAKDNQAEAVKFADSVVRTTQPTGERVNLPSVMRGGPWQKAFTMFMSHFSNMHNTFVMEMDRLNYSKEHPLRKFGNFMEAYFWIVAAPSVTATFIRSGGEEDDWKVYLGDMVLYNFAGLLLVRDIANSMIKGFSFGQTPAFAAWQYASYAVRSKSWRKKAVNSAKFVAIGTGKIPIQAISTIDGAADLMLDETEDWRRLALTEYQLEGKGRKRSKKDRFRP